MKNKKYNFYKGAIALSFILGMESFTSYAQDAPLLKLLAMSRAVGPNSASLYYPADSVQYFNKSDSTRYYYPEGSSLSSGNMIFVNSGGWKTLARQSFAYDAGGNRTENLQEMYNSSTGNFDKDFRYLWTFNAAGKELTKEGQTWPAGATSWNLHSRQEQTYDASNNITKINYPIPVNGAWTTGKQSLFTYLNSSQGKPLTKEDQTWTNGAWVNTFRTTWGYDGSGMNMVSRIVQVWNANSSSWTNSTRSMYTTNADGRIMQEVLSSWNPSTQAWTVSQQRFSYTYNAAGYVTRKVAEGNTSTTSISFMNSSETTYTYNSANQLLTERVLGANNNVFTINRNSSITRYYYQTTSTTGIRTPQKGGAMVAVYPNPAVDELNINLKWSDAQAFTATFSDMAGRVFTSFSGPAAKEYSTTLQLGNIPSGNYLLTIHGSNGNATNQMVTVKH